MLRSCFSTSLLILSLVGSFLLAPAAQAGVVVTLDNPFQTVSPPASGNLILNFTGTVSFDKGSFYNGASLAFAFDSNSNVITTSFSSFDFASSNDGGSASGLLFTATVSSTTPLGLYNVNLLNPGGVPQLIINSKNNLGTESSSAASFSITVVAAVPEPASSSLLALASIAVAGVLTLRHGHDGPKGQADRAS